jgi:hypothetical protein
VRVRLFLLRLRAETDQGRVALHRARYFESDRFHSDVHRCANRLEWRLNAWRELDEPQIA